MNRRKFLTTTGLGLAGIGLGTGLYTWQWAPYQLEFTHTPMPIKNLPSELEGKTLMQISDIHIGKRFDPKYIVESFKKAKKYNPDFVVYTGDYVTTHHDKILYPLLINTMKHCVYGKLGTIAILGNHDYGKNFQEAEEGDKVAKTLESLKIRVLRNESTAIENLNFYGFDDLWGTNFKPEKTLENLNLDEANLVLCHNPDVCDLPVWNNYNGWILSGHTHGGQCKAPFLPPPILPVKNKRYSAGKIDLEDGRTLYINRALGCSYPIRFNVPPEISLFTLQRA
ncbi:phosphoesterase [Ornithobacterium rhinotracheale]|uniref:metallophosphoesterase n=1 Tax=Ornithobacterium rhinotracheale TaxID=28251 RepID=UPI00129CCE2E|nr:metallophosphoesterase [Ornithobacterium rhinotracheale]MRI63483.1 phosphoesterase [Ornithobacterium rhinotracheale]